MSIYREAVILILVSKDTTQAVQSNKQTAYHKTEMIDTVQYFQRANIIGIRTGGGVEKAAALPKFRQFNFLGNDKKLSRGGFCKISFN